MILLLRTNLFGRVNVDNAISKSQLKSIAESLSKTLNMVRVDSKFRDKFKKEFNPGEQQYLRTIAERFKKWDKTEYPTNFKCRFPENKVVLTRVIKFYKEATDDAQRNQAV